MPDTCQICPLSDPRWKPFLQRHPDASVFHSEEWLRTLQKTYGFEAAALTTSSPGNDLQNALLFCRVDSPLTGHRLVSLPFSDHCAPLGGGDDLAGLVDALLKQINGDPLQYAELRPVKPLLHDGPLHAGRTYRLHRLDLTPELRDIYAGFHKDCVARKIRRAEREGLRYRRGSESHLADFWKLFLMTRRHHHSPPQPIDWFQNLLREFGDAAAIHIASLANVPVAAILTLEFKDTLFFKYGCSDPQFQPLGGNQLVFWKAIQDARTRGLRTFDFGRSDTSNEGLVRFKDRWGAQRTDLIYSRFIPHAQSRFVWRDEDQSLASQFARQALSHLPDRLFAVAGQLLYKHIA
jgi:lipid II:glycine glycyltransferase (peptidoglycan interpeptide bridge formation enzyme)